MTGEKTTSDDLGPSGTVRHWLQWIRDGSRSDLVTSVGFLLAAAIGTVHWIGLVAGGIIVGFSASSMRRAFVLAVYLSGFWLLSFVGWLWFAGVLTRAVATGELFGLSIALAVVLPLVGASIRGLG